MNKALIERNANRARHLTNTADDGRFGRAFELECARTNSRKTRVSKQGQIDVSVKFAGNNGKAKYEPCEVKIIALQSYNQILQKQHNWLLQISI